MKLALRTPLARDLAVAVAVTAAAQLELVLLAGEVDGPLVWHHVTSLLMLPALTLRRRAPLTSILVAAVGLVFQPLIGPAAVAIPYLALLFLLASLGWFAPFRHGVAGVTVTLVCGLAYDTLTGAAPVADIVVNAALLVLAWMAGHGLRVATDRRVAAELEADRAARAAVEAERGRIARDMHDSLGHALTLMTLQAGSARERVEQPVASDALASIELAGREALADLHRVLGLIGSEGDTGRGLAHLPDLIAGTERGGLQVDVDVQAGVIPGSVANAMYRVVQEALTNVTRHSQASTASVRVCHRAGDLVAVVADPGPARHDARPGTGRGLSGLRQRLELFGGTHPPSAGAIDAGAIDAGAIDVTGLRVVIADDEPLVRHGLRMVLEFGGDMTVVAEAADGRRALAAISEHRPDLALLDIRMPVMDGIELCQRIVASQQLAAVRPVVLTTFADDELVVAALRAGAAGYLLKSMPPDQIRQAVRTAVDGQTALAPPLVDRLVRDYTNRRVQPSPALERLTERETDVLREIAHGRSNLEIADALYISEGTVKTHVASLLRKLELRDRTQAAVAAYELGLVSPGGAG